MAAPVDRLVGVLNGLIGDHLARSRNELATRMGLVHRGALVPLDRAALAAAYPEARPRVIVLVHGLMGTENNWRFADGRDDYGAALAGDLNATALYVRYNTGLPITDNGAAFAALLEALLDVYPVDIAELTLVGHSMGGLVIRGACHAGAEAGHRWLGRVKRAIYVGTPHRGAPLERIGRVVAGVLEAVPDPYTKLLAQIANLRSDGIKDLGDADVRHEDRARRVTSLALRDARHPVPLLPSIEHYLIAGTIATAPWLTALFGDAIVPLASATDGAARPGGPLPPSHVAIVPGVGHLELAHHAAVGEQLRAWCRGAAEATP